MTKKLLLVSLLVSGLCVGCKKKEEAPAEPAAEAPPAEPTEPAEPIEPTEPAAEKVAVAQLMSAPDAKVSGTVTFTSKPGGVEIAAQIEGLEPGDHGFHIHEKGECTPPDFKSAGGHFNPTGAAHGAPDAPEHHAGDLGNITANEEGVAEKTMLVDYIALGEGETDVIGKAVMVHSGPDDFKTQPTGAAGSRVACGVIELQEKEKEE